MRIIKLSNKRQHLLLANTLIIACLLSACGGGSPDDSASTISPPAEAVPATPGLEPAVPATEPVELIPDATPDATPATPSVATPATSTVSEEPDPQSAGETSTSIQPPPDAEPAPTPAAPALTAKVVQALNTGDVTGVSVAQLLNDAVSTGEHDLQMCVDTLKRIYPNGLVEAEMPYLSNYVYSASRSNYPLHVANDSGEAYSWIGEHESGSRFVYFGAGIFQITDSTYWGNLGSTLKNNTLDVMTWITRSTAVAQLRLSGLRIFAVSQRARIVLENWLSQLNISNDWTITTDPAVLTTGDYDLMIGLVGGDLPELDAVLAASKPIMLWSEVFNPGSGIHKLGLSWAWWGEQTIGNGDSVEEQCELAYPGKDILATFRSLRDDQLSFNYSADTCPLNIYTIRCRSAELLRSDGTSFQDAFLTGAQALQSQLQQTDFSGTSIFSADSNSRMAKFGVLIGDKIRQNISYPMDKVSSSTADFFGAYFADHTLHYARDTNPAQTDAGTFSDHLNSIGTQPAESASVTISPTTYAEWSSTGVTGRAGKPVTVTRLDSNPSAVSVRFNMIRSGSTWEWNTMGYTRPKFVTSHEISLPPAGTITLTSPVGGPLYVHWEAQAADAPDFELQIEGAVSHPLLSVFEDDDINQFSNALSTEQFDWVDIKTPFAEVHSLNRRMLDAFNAQDGDASNGFTATDVKDWVSDLNTYLISTNLGLAGFIGDGLPAIKPNVAAFCSSHNLRCEDTALHRKPPAQHINADRNASCGDLCSGNPFDLNSFVKPLGYGESHEMGHNMQRYRLNFYGARSSETSNNIFPHYSAFRWLQDEGLTQHPKIRLPDPAKAYAQLQTSIANAAIPSEGHPIWIDTQIYANADVRLMLYLQLAFIHDQWEYDPATGANGWDVFTKLYKLERQFTQALTNDTEWAAQKNNLGFSTYERSAAKAISGNDFMAIAQSWIARVDHRQYLYPWGVAVSTQAGAQIESNGYTSAVPMIYWRTPDDRYIRTEFPSRNTDNVMPLDGVTSW